jgi:hypothetical protein
MSIMTFCVNGIEDHDTHASDNVKAGFDHDTLTFMSARHNGPPMQTTAVTPGKEASAVWSSVAVAYNGQDTFVPARRKNHSGVFIPADACFRIGAARIVKFRSSAVIAPSSTRIDALDKNISGGLEIVPGMYLPALVHNNLFTVGSSAEDGYGIRDHMEFGLLDFVLE